MKHLPSSGSVRVHVESIAAVSALALLLNLTPASAGAEPLVALGQERAQLSSNTLTTAAKTPSSAKDPVRKPHKLIKKSAPLATVQPSGTASSTAPTTLSATTSTVQGTTTQTLSNDSTAHNPSTSTTVAPTKTTSVTTSPTTSLSFGAALSTAPSTGTASSVLPLSAVAAPGSSVQDKTNSGRGMQRLSTAMPGFNQMLTPATAAPPSPTASSPVIGRNPASLSFSAMQGGTNPSGQTVTVTNGGSGTLSWTATSTVSWLTVNGSSAASGTNTGLFSVGANTSGLSVGTYSGNVTIGATGATNTPQSVPVTLSITAAPTPTIGLSATNLSYSGVQGASNPTAQTLTISNAGAGTLTWSVIENSPWLTPNVVNGTGSGAVTFSVNSAGMSAGTYTAPVTIAATGATNTPQTINVTLTLTAPSIPTIGLAPTSLTFSAAQGGANPSPQAVVISNAGTGSLSWNASSAASWLSVSPASGSGAGSLTVSANVGALSPGTYTSAITVTGMGATNTPQTIPVTFTVTAPASTLTVGSSSLTFSASQGGANPAAQSLSITSNVAWSVSEAVSWLSVSPAMGSNNGTVAVTVDTATAAVGNNTGTITVTGGGLTRTVNVTLTLNAPSPTLTLGSSNLSFSATQGAANPSAQSLSITSNVSWTVNEAVNWLSVTPASGVNNGSVTVTIDATAAVVGTNSGTITVSGGGLTRSVNVTLDLAAAPTTLNVSSSSLTFAATQGAANPGSQTLAITSNTSWTVTDNASWLSVSPTSGSNNGTLTVMVNTSTAGAGTNSATITLTGGGITRTVNVGLTLSAPATSSATLSWTPNTETDLASYRVYQSTAAGVYGAPIATIPAGTNTYTVNSLAVGTTYFFRITAVDTANNESQPSNEVSKSIF